MPTAQALSLKGLAQGAPRRACRALRGRLLTTALIVTLTLLNVAHVALADFPIWATPQKTEYATGEAFLRKLAEPQEFLRDGLTRREAMTRTSETTGVAIWLDRRLDPSVEREWRTTGEPLEPALLSHLAPEQATAARVGDVLYIGPKELSIRIEPYCELQRGEARRAPGTRGRKLAEKKPFGWEPLTEPRAILEQIGQAYGLEIVGLDQVPQDVWAGAKLPDADAATQLSLVLGSFDRTFQWRDRGAAIEIGGMDGGPQGRTALNGRLATSVAFESWTERFPALTFEKTDGILYADGPWEELVRVSRVSLGEPAQRAAPTTTEGQKRYSMNVKEQPAGAVVKTIAERSGLEVDLPADLVDRLRSRVTLDVKELELDDLLRRTLHPVGVDFEIDGMTLVLKEKAEL